MANWHEPQTEGLAWIFPARDGRRVAAIFRNRDIRTEPHCGIFLRFEGQGETPRGAQPWDRNPEGWFELRPLTPLFAHSELEAKEKLALLLPQIEEGSGDAEFVKRAYQPLIEPSKVKEIEHPTREVKALLFAHPDGLIEARFFLHVLLGRWGTLADPASGGEEWDWLRTWVRDENDQPLRTLADDLVSAEQIAIADLELLVRQQPEIRWRQLVPTP